MRIPDGEYDAILVSGLAESFGCLERFVLDAANHLAPDGVLVIDHENLSAPRSLKFVIEGRVGNMDPFGSMREPQQRVHMTRVVDAVEASGLLLEEIYLVPSRIHSIGPKFVKNIFREGFVALPFLNGTPPSRAWLVARKTEVLAGSIVIGPGAEDAVQCTMAAVATFLPDDGHLGCIANHLDEVFDAVLSA